MNNLKLPINLKFLFRILKKEKGLSKTHFIHELKIARSTLHNWEKGGNISKNHLRAVAEYFNRYLGLNLNTDDLQTKDLENEYKKNKLIIRESYGNYFLNTTSKQKALLTEFNRLDDESQELIIKLIRKLSKLRGNHV